MRKRVVNQFGVFERSESLVGLKMINLIIWYSYCLLRYSDNEEERSFGTWPVARDGNGSDYSPDGWLT
jgi:hypothetical protein